MRSGWGNRSTRRKHVSMPLSRPQNPHDDLGSKQGRRSRKPATNRLGGLQPSRLAQPSCQAKKKNVLVSQQPYMNSVLSANQCSSDEWKVLDVPFEVMPIWGQSPQAGVQFWKKYNIRSLSGNFQHVTNPLMPVRDVGIFWQVSQVISCKTYHTAHGELVPPSHLPLTVSNILVLATQTTYNTV